MTQKEFTHIRKFLGKTQKQMAELLGASLKAVSSYEQGWRSVPTHVERQLYFLLSRKASVSKRIRPCWELKKCQDHIREKCPAWEFDAGRLCWFINGTFCESCAKNTWEEKIEMCKTCPVFRPVAELVEGGD